MKKLLVLFLAITTIACAQEKQPILGETDWQRQMNADFKDATKSPLTDKDRKGFKGLDFFKFDSAYIVNAKLKRTPDEKPFKMKTTTDRLADYVKFGVITFELDGKEHELNIYQNIGLLKKPGYEDYLFLPFLDNTNGEESYSGGRYVEARIPEGNEIVIDFNTAYNPYCAYSDRYSCPIVPRENTLYTKVEAGVKAYKKH